MGLASLGSLIAMLGVAEPPESTPSVVASAVHGESDRVQLRVPELSFGRPSTLRILGEGRFGTWSIVGLALGSTVRCTETLSVHCAGLTTAQVGIAWRPFGSLVSLFSAIGVTVVPGMDEPPGFLVVSGLRVDLPSRTRWKRRKVR